MILMTLSQRNQISDDTAFADDAFFTMDEDADIGGWQT